MNENMFGTIKCEPPASAGGFLAETFDGDFSHRPTDADRHETIKKILSELERIWNDDSAQRFFQMIYCLQRKFSHEHKIDGKNYGEITSGEEKGYDLFYVEDDSALKFLKEQTTTDFYKQMEWATENPGDAFFCSSTLRKERSKLPANLVCGEGEMWKQDGVYKIGVQIDDGERRPGKIFAMSICDDPQILSDKDKISLTAEQIEEVREFVKTHRRELKQMIRTGRRPKALFGF